MRLVQPSWRGPRALTIQLRAEVGGDGTGRHVEEAGSTVGVTEPSGDLAPSDVGIETDAGRPRPVRRVRLAVGLREESDDGTPRPLGILLTHEDEDHRGVAGLLSILGQNGRGRRFVGGLVGEVRGSHHRDIDLAGLQRPHRQLQRIDAGELLAGDGEARCPPVLAGVDAVRRDVGHAADDPRRREMASRTIVGGSPALHVHVLGDELPKTHPQPVPCRFRVHAHPDVDPRAIRIHGPHLGQGFVEDGEDGRLLSETLLQIVGRKAQLRHRKGDLPGHGGGLHPRTDQATDEGRKPPVLSDEDAHARDGQAGTRRRLRPGVATGDVFRRDGLDRGPRGLCRHAPAVPAGPLLHDEVGVVPTEAEVADGRPTRPVAAPRLGLGKDPEAVLPDGGEGVVAGCRRKELGVEGAQDLEKARDARRRDGVADVALQRADDGSRSLSPDLRQALQLDLVSPGRARGVAFDEADVRRRNLGPGIRCPHRPYLAGGRRRQEAGLPPVVGEPDSPDHPEDPVPGGDGVLQTLQRHEAGALGREQTVSSLVEGP